ncbi:MAG: aldolase/citrate lyase family protein [Smithellaceae bacterium]|nr:aldolase/citrate lyase family protein [Smithellaceae bacterium]
MDMKQLREGKKAVGTMVRMVRNPASAWMAHQAGLDFIMLDLEHGPFNMETVEDVFKVGRGLNLGCLVRVPELSKGYVSRIMDAGATGVMAPMLETKEQAELLVRWSKYAPPGNRGYGAIGGHTNFQAIPPGDTTAFMVNANEETISIAQIETALAIKNIEEIASVPGLDALLLGPNDLAISLGCAGDLLGPVLDAAIGKVAEATRRHGKIFGMHAPEALLDRWIPKGCNLIMSNLDANILLAGMKAISGRYKV